MKAFNPTRNVKDKKTAAQQSVTPDSSTDFFKNSRPEMFCKKGLFKNFLKFTEKHLCQSLLFNKVATLLNFIKDTLKAFDDCKNEQKSI